MKERVEELLARLAAIQAGQYKNDAYYVATKSEIMGWLPPEQQARLAELEGDHMDQAAALRSREAELVDEIKSLTAQLGETCKAAGLMAMYVKGRTSWDSKALDGYALAHPEILSARKVGEPSVTIKVAT